jgi:MoxR-like ATPase
MDLNFKRVQFTPDLMPTDIDHSLLAKLARLELNDRSIVSLR